MYGKWIKKYKERAILQKIFLGTFLISFFFIILVCSIGFTWLSKVTESQLVENDKRVLANYDIVFDNYMTSAKNTAETLYKNVYVNRMIVRNESQWSDNMSVIANTILNNIMVNNWVHSLFIMGTDGVLLKASNYTLFPERNIDSLVGEAFPQSLKSKLFTWSYTGIDGSTEELLGVSVGEWPARQTVPVGIMVNIDIGSITKEMFSHNWEGENFFILDGKGIILGSVGDLFSFGQRIDDLEIYKTIFKEKSENSFSKLDFQGEKYFLSYITAQDNSYSIVHMLPYHYIQDPVARIRWIILSLGIAMGMGSLFLSTYVSARVYHPIDEFVDSVASSGLEKPEARAGKTNELAAASTTFTHMASRLSDYRKEIEAEQMVKYLSAKSNQTSPPKAFEEILNSFGASSLYSVAVLRVGYPSNLTESNGEEPVNESMEALCDIVSNHFQQTCETKTFIMDNEYIASIVFHQNPDEDAKSKLEALGLEVIELISGVFPFKLNMGLGNPCKEVGELRQSYRIACAAAGYRFLFGENTVITEDEMQACAFHSSEKSYDLSPLIQSVRSMNEGEFTREYEKMEAFIKTRSLQTAFETLIGAACEMRRIQSDLSRDNANMDFKTYETIRVEIQRLNFLSEARQWFGDYFMSIKNYRNQLQNTGSFELVSKAIQYINQNYNDYNLTAQHLSGKFGITPSYFSRIFNEYANCAFPDYLSNVRLEESRKLLLQNPKASIQEICTEVGYTNTSYYTALFKKRYGITPGKYRQNSMREG